MSAPATDQIEAPVLSEIGQRFVLHWGEMGSRWGVNRTVAQIHALLFYTGEPLNAELIASTLGVARSNVSNSLRELQSLKLVKVVHQMGDRRDYFSTSKDVWSLLRTIVRTRKAREFDPTVNMLDECVKDPEFSLEEKEQQARIQETLELMSSLSGWSEEMLRLEPATLMKMMKLGSRISLFLRKDEGPDHGD